MWEKIPENEDTATPEAHNPQQNHSARLRVPGGWLVRSISFGREGTGVGQTFVEDHEHSWSLDS
jgi:hypothetical protein